VWRNQGHIGHKSSSTSACVTELLTNGPNENRILLHSLLKKIQEWMAVMRESDWRPSYLQIKPSFCDRRGATYEMLAERMDVPLGTMKTWIRRSLIKLRACLER
jgi:DNA-directed RNA polymerase specialized sigma24 family protein